MSAPHIPVESNFSKKSEANDVPVARPIGFDRATELETGCSPT